MPKECEACRGSGKVSVDNPAYDGWREQAEDPNEWYSSSAGPAPPQTIEATCSKCGGKGEVPVTTSRGQEPRHAGKALQVLSDAFTKALSGEDAIIRTPTIAAEAFLRKRLLEAAARIKIVTEPEKE